LEKKKTMKIAKNKTMATMIALFLALTIAATAIALPTANAQQTVATHAFLDVMPNPIGVDQSVFVAMWLLEVNPVSFANIQGQGSGTGTGTATTGVWSGYTVTVTAPDGSNTTLGPYVSSDISTVNVMYTPTQVGTYTFTFNFPGQNVTGTSLFGFSVNSYYEPSSATCTLTVQEEPLTPLPQTPLPTDYWTRPINWQNQHWYSISGNWFCGNTFGIVPSASGWSGWNGWYWNTSSYYNPDEIPPTSAHIMWTSSETTDISFGGQIGGSLYSANDLSNYYVGKSYETFFSPIIINGVLFYNSPVGIKPSYGTYAVDLRTGQRIWYNNDTAGVFYGEVFSHHNPNEVGGIAYLWGVSGSTWSLYDATRGNWILNVVGSPGGAAVWGPEGELLVYTLNNGNGTTGWLSMWNSTLELGAMHWPSNGWEYRPPTGASLPWSLGVQWNVTVPIYLAPSRYTGTNLTETIEGINDGVILAITGNLFNPQDYQMEVGYSATTGACLWHQNRSVAQAPGQTAWGLMGPVSSGVYTEFNKATLQYYGFSILTGEQLWGPTNALPYAENSYTFAGVPSDKIFVTESISGIFAFNFTNGALVWNFTSPPAGLQTAFPFYPFETMPTPIICGSGGDQMVFASTGNTHGDQLFRGAQLYGINATNGQQVWSADGMFASLASTDGYLVGLNAYDNQIYCFGKGPSETSVTAPDIGVTTGTSIMITGSVYDISAGSQKNAVAANFPHGLPCVSDASESQFMAAVYEQQPMPTNVTGVPVTLSAIDPNGNDITLGTTTSDASGFYSFIVNTDQLSAGPGKYTVIATFAGSESYWPSHAETAFGVSEAPPATAGPEYPQPIDNTMTIIGATIAIIIAVAIAAIWIKRK
jgi:hypothetical protein